MMVISKRPEIASKTDREGAEIQSCESIDELLSYFDEPFVAAAYRSLLLRQPDPDGLRYYAERLRAGSSRISVLDQITRSAEVREDWTSIEGIADAIAEYRRSRRLSGWKRALFDPELGRTLGLRRARAVKNNVGAQRQILQKCLEDLAMRQLVLGSEIAAIAENSRGRDFDPHGTADSILELRPRLLGEVRECDLPSPARSAAARFRF